MKAFYCDFVINGSEENQYCLSNSPTLYKTVFRHRALRRNIKNHKRMFSSVKILMLLFVCLFLTEL